MDKVLLFHGIGNTGCGCNTGKVRRTKKMAGSALGRYYDPYTKTHVRRRRRSRRVRGINGFGQAVSIRENFSAIKGIVYTGAIAGAGAIVTDYVWGKIGTQFNLQNEMLALAKMATGVGIGLIVSKVFKKPQLGVAFAMGPVVVGIKDMLKGALGLAGVPYVSTPGFKRAISSVNGVPAIGPATPSWLTEKEAIPHWEFAA